jgi:hypothetical protein
MSGACGACADWAVGCSIAEGDRAWLEEAPAITISAAASHVGNIGFPLPECRAGYASSSLGKVSAGLHQRQVGEGDDLRR